MIPTAAGATSRSALHFAAIAGLLLVILVRWWPSLGYSGPLNDELAYVAAARRVAAGRSPFSVPSYLYPSIGAVVLARASEWFGEGSSLVVLRLLNRLGLAALAWLSACLLGWRPVRAWALAAAYVCLAPAVGFAFFTANLSPLLAAVTALGLTCWPRRPVAAGLALGAGIAIKPLAWAALPVLALHRPTSHRRSAVTAAGIATAAVALLVLLPPWGPALFGAVRGMHLPVERSASLHRLLHLGGLTEWAPILSLAVVGCALWAGRRRALTATEATALALAASATATPVVWSHTLLLTLPLQAIAWRRARQTGGPLAALLVLLAIVALQLAEGVTGIDHRSPVLQALSVLPPALAPAGLAVWILRSPPDASRSARADPRT